VTVTTYGLTCLMQQLLHTLAFVPHAADIAHSDCKALRPAALGLYVTTVPPEGFTVTTCQYLLCGTRSLCNNTWPTCIFTTSVSRPTVPVSKCGFYDTILDVADLLPAAGCYCGNIMDSNLQ